MYKEAHKLLENNKEALMLLEKGRRNKFCLWIIDVVLVLVIFLVCFLYLKGELGHGYLLAVAGFVVGLFLMLMLTSILDNPVLSNIELDYVNSVLNEYKEVCNKDCASLLKEGDKYYIYDSSKNRILDIIKIDNEMVGKEYTLITYRYFKLSNKGSIKDYFEYSVSSKN